MENNTGLLKTSEPSISSSSVLRILLASPTRDLMEGGGISGISTPSSLSRSRSHSSGALNTNASEQVTSIKSNNSTIHHLKSKSNDDDGDHEDVQLSTNGFGEKKSNLNTELLESKEKLKLLSERLHAVSSSSSSFATRLNGAAASSFSLSLPPLPPTHYGNSASPGSSVTSSALSALSPPRANMTSTFLSPSLVVTPASVEGSALDTSVGSGEGREREQYAHYIVDSTQTILTTTNNVTSPAARALEFERSLRLSHSRELAMVVDDSRRSLDSERQKNAALLSQIRSAAETEAKLLQQLNEARSESLQNIARATSAADRAAESERRASQREMGHMAQISETVSEMQKLRALAETAEATSRMAALMKSESEAMRAAEAAAHTLALEKTQSLHTLSIEKLNAANSAILAKTISEHQAALKEAESQYQSALETISRNAANASMQAQTERITLIHAHELDIASLSARSTAALAEKEAEKSSAISALKSQHAEALSDLNASHASEMASIETSHMSFIKECETEHASLLSKMTLQHANEVNELRLTNALTISQLKESHSFALGAAKNEFNAEIALIIAREKKERETLELSLTTLHSNAIKDLELSHKRDISTLHMNFDKEINAMKESHRLSLESTQNEHMLTMTEIKNAFEITQKEYNDEISSLQNQLNDRDDDLEARENELTVLRLTSSATIDEVKWINEKKVAELTMQLEHEKSNNTSLLNDFEMIKSRLLLTETELTTTKDQQASSQDEIALLKRDLAGAQQDIVSLRDRIRYQASSNEVSIREANEALQRTLAQRDEGIKFEEMKRVASEAQYESKLNDIKVFYNEEAVRKETALKLYYTEETLKREAALKANMNESTETRIKSISDQLKASFDIERIQFQEALDKAQSVNIISSNLIQKLKEELDSIRIEREHEKEEASQSIKITNDLFEAEKTILTSQLKDAQLEDITLRTRVNELESELKRVLTDLMFKIEKIIEESKTNEENIKKQAATDLAVCMNEHKIALDTLNSTLESERKTLLDKTAAANVLAKRATRALLDLAQKQITHLTNGGVMS
jgi:hypothetical protein